MAPGWSRPPSSRARTVSRRGSVRTGPGGRGSSPTRSTYADSRTLGSGLRLRRGPLGLGRGCGGHRLGHRHLRGVAHVPLRVERGLAAGAGRGDRLAVGVVDEVAGREYAGAVGQGRLPLGGDIALGVDLDLAGDELRLWLVPD